MGTWVESGSNALLSISVSVEQRHQNSSVRFGQTEECVGEENYFLHSDENTVLYRLVLLHFPF